MENKHSPGTERFIRAVTDFIFVEDQPEKADVILIPGGRKIEHAIHAAELYRQGYAPYVLPAGGYGVKLGKFIGVPEKYRADYPDEYETEWAFLKAVLVKHGVPEEAILREDKSTYTWENAQFSRRVLEAQGIPMGTAILACKAYHARRALLYYQAAMPATRFIVCPQAVPGLARDDWFLNPYGRERVLGEVQRLGGQIGEVFAMMLEDSADVNR